MDYGTLASPNDFSQLTPAEITEYETWSDGVNEQVVDDMAEQDEAYHKRLYQSAKFKFDTLHVFSQPDSLTRRGEMLILRRAVTVEQANNGVIDDWRETLTDLFKHGVTVCDASVDSRYTASSRTTKRSVSLCNSPMGLTSTPIRTTLIS